MKKTANLNAVPKKDSTAAESIKMTSTERPQLWLVFGPFVDLIARSLSDACKRRRRVPCNPFYVNYISNTDLPEILNTAVLRVGPTEGCRPAATRQWLSQQPANVRQTRSRAVQNNGSGGCSINVQTKAEKPPHLRDERPSP